MARLPAVLKRDLSKLFRSVADTICGGLSSRFAPNNIDFGAALGAGPQGMPCVSRLDLNTNPTAGDIVGIAGQEFLLNSVLGAPSLYIQVKIQASATLTTEMLAKAINGIPDPDIVPATVPFTTPLVASRDAGYLRIALADRRGGTELEVCSPTVSIPLFASLTASRTWTSGSDINTDARDQIQGQWTVVSFTITAARLADGNVFLELPFTPTETPLLTVYDSTNKQVVRDEAITFPGVNKLLLVLAGGAAPNYQSGDKVTLLISKY